MKPIAFVGGTGPAGFGLAQRLAAGGEAVVIGSRNAARAAEAAGRLRAAVPGAQADGRTNLDAVARADRVVLSVPFDGLVALLPDLAPALAGKLIIDMVVPLTREGDLLVLAPIAGAASVGELLQARIPTARVVSAFKNVPAARLVDLTAPLAGDVVLCGHDDAARAEVAALVRLLPGLRPVDAGGLANARFLEAVTALLLNVNRRHHALATIQIVGLP